jgi:GTP-binding protein
MSQFCRVVIVGRPNVGKSTLFNRLIGRRRALVHDEPGVTRDRLEEEGQWWIRGHSFSVKMVDTGGLGGERFSDEIEKQVKLALSQADVVLFLFDSQSGLTPLDEELLRELNRSGVTERLPVLAIVNKVDAEVHEANASDFYSLGMEQVLTISAEHGRGIDDLQLAIADAFGFEPAEVAEVPEAEEATEEEASPPKRTPRIAIVGRPNVGKSTLINALLGEDRMITSSIAGTTVDSVDSLVKLNDKEFLFIDTAGIRRKNKTEQGVEVLSVVQTRKALEQADIAILVLDGETGISEQDEKIGGLIEEVGCSVVLAMNKWDTQRKNPEFTKELAAERIRGKMAYLKYAPILFTSGLKGQGFGELGDLLDEILHQRRVKIATHEFTEWIREKTEVNNPANAKFFLCHQSGRNPPTFVCHVSDPDKVHFSLRRHLINELRDRWGYMGTPIRMLFIEGKNRRSLPRKKNTSGYRVKESRKVR